MDQMPSRYPEIDGESKEVAQARAKVIGGAVGHFVEWYDWAIYGLMAGTFSKLIFPASDPATSLLLTFLTFALGFGARPLGALFLAPMADRKGRRFALSVSIVLMGLGTLIMATTPTYATIGIFSPVLFVFARLLQGVSAGGEFQSAAVFLTEHAPAHRRALAGSAQMVGLGLSLLVASATSALVVRLIKEPALSEWGWRLPFLLGAMLALWAVYLRLRLPDTPAFATAVERRSLSTSPLAHVVKHYRLNLFYVLVLTLSNIHFYVWAVFLPTYANQVAGLPIWEGLTATTISLGLFTIASPLAGLLADKIGRKPLMFTWAIGFALLSYPMISMLATATFSSFMLVSATGLLLMSLLFAVLPVTLAELFPTEVRTTGIGVPYAVGTAIFGGTAPLVAAWLIGRGQAIGISYYIIGASLICVISFLTMVETKDRDLTQP